MSENDLENEMNSIWTKKYAPKSIKEMVLSPDIREKVEKFLEDGEFPSLLLAGSPGKGKTTLAKLLTQEVDAMVKLINGSTTNGVDNVRGEIDMFVKTMSIDGSIKVVIIDEADRLSPQAQDALRALMEDNLLHTRFILTANNINRITPALQSRCTAINLNPSLNDYVKFLAVIAKSESPSKSINTTDLDKIIQIANINYPDIRSGINLLQNSIDKNGNINIKYIASNNIENFAVELLNSIKTKPNIIEIRKQWLDNEALFTGDYINLMVKLFEAIFSDSTLDNMTKSKLMIETHSALEQADRVVDQEINFYVLILKMVNSL